LHQPDDETLTEEEYVVAYDDDGEEGVLPIGLTLDFTILAQDAAKLPAMLLAVDEEHFGLENILEYHFVCLDVNFFWLEAQPQNARHERFEAKVGQEAEEGDDLVIRAIHAVQTPPARGSPLRCVSPLELDQTPLFRLTSDTI
jgi:hypothetical protein